MRSLPDPLEATHLTWKGCMGNMGDDPRREPACCGEKPLRGADLPPGCVGPGGGRIGAVLLSSFIRPGMVSDMPYNHCSRLRSVEDLFGLPHLGYAAKPDRAAFGRDVFTGSG